MAGKDAVVCNLLNADQMDGARFVADASPNSAEISPLFRSLTRQRSVKSTECL